MTTEDEGEWPRYGEGRFNDGGHSKPADIPDRQGGVIDTELNDDETKIEVTIQYPNGRRTTKIITNQVDRGGRPLDSVSIDESAMECVADTLLGQPVDEEGKIHRQMAIIVGCHMRTLEESEISK